MASQEVQESLLHTVEAVVARASLSHESNTGKRVAYPFVAINRLTPPAGATCLLHLWPAWKPPTVLAEVPASCLSSVWPSVFDFSHWGTKLTHYKTEWLQFFSSGLEEKRMDSCRTEKGTPC